MAEEFTQRDHHWMQLALEQAEKAAQQGEVPIGAVLVHNDQLLSTAYNQVISLNDPSAHAEVLCIRQACDSINNYRLPPGATLYVTLEPCMMCAGILVHSRLSRLVFSASDSKSHRDHSAEFFLNSRFHNHQVTFQSGLLHSSSASMLRKFFQKRR